MFLFELFTRKTIIGFSILIVMLCPLVNSSEANVQSQQSGNDTSQSRKIYFNLPPVADNGAPGGRRKGAGSHSLCEVNNHQTETSPLIALMPEILIETATKSKTYVWGKTALDHPTFWFYVAYPANTYAEFVLQDEAENEIYQTTLILNNNPGIVSLTIPKDKSILETGKSYHWYFNVMCNSNDTPDDFVEGWVEKVKLNSIINPQLESSHPLEPIDIYARNGLWYDTLTNLDRLRQEEPGNKAVAAIWTDLLQQVGLEEISQEPVVKHYNLEN